MRFKAQDSGGTDLKTKPIKYFRAYNEEIGNGENFIQNPESHFYYNQFPIIRYGDQ